MGGEGSTPFLMGEFNSSPKKIIPLGIKLDETASLFLFLCIRIGLGSMVSWLQLNGVW